MKDFFSLYNGIFEACLGIFVYRVSYFGLYSAFKGSFREGSKMKIFGLAHLITVLSGLAAYPFETLKGRATLGDFEEKRGVEELTVSDCYAGIGIAAFNGVGLSLSLMSFHILKGDFN